MDNNPGIRGCEPSCPSGILYSDNLPTQGEINAAVNDFVSYLERNYFKEYGCYGCNPGDWTFKIDKTEVVAFHYEQANYCPYPNSVELQVTYTLTYKGEREGTQYQDVTYLVYTPSRDTFEFITCGPQCSLEGEWCFTYPERCESAGLIRGFKTGSCTRASPTTPVTQRPYTTYPTPRPTTPSDGGDDDSIIWDVFIGIGLVTGAAAGGKLLVDHFKRSKTPPPAQQKQKEKKKEEEKPSKYILQISTDRMAIDREKPGDLTVTVWKQVGSQPPQQAQEATISLTVPSDAGLIITPSSGQGQLKAKVKTGEDGKSGEFPLTVTATARGSTEKATIIVRVESDYVMKFD
jgi:hypothetical protein